MWRLGGWTPCLSTWASDWSPHFCWRSLPQLPWRQTQLFVVISCIRGHCFLNFINIYRLQPLPWRHTRLYAIFFCLRKRLGPMGWLPPCLHSPRQCQGRDVVYSGIQYSPAWQASLTFLTKSPAVKITSHIMVNHTHAVPNLYHAIFYRNRRYKI